MHKHKSYKSAHFRGELSGAVKQIDNYIEFHLKTKPIKKETPVVKVKCRVYDSSILGTFYKRDYLDITGMMHIKRTLADYSKTNDGFILVEGVRRFGQREEADRVEIVGKVEESVDSGQMMLEI